MKVAIGLGASLGDRRAALELAVSALDGRGMRLIRASRWYRSPPLAGGRARNLFLNGVAVYDTDLEPLEILARCQDLERRAGRRRAHRWGDRPLDLDVLLVEDLVRSDAILTLPHPAIALRPFVLWPLVEAWPDAVDPVGGRPYADIECDALPRPWAVGVARRSQPALPPGAARRTKPTTETP